MALATMTPLTFVHLGLGERFPLRIRPSRGRKSSIGSLTHWPTALPAQFFSTSSILLLTGATSLPPRRRKNIDSTVSNETTALCKASLKITCTKPLRSHQHDYGLWLFGGSHDIYSGNGSHRGQRGLFFAHGSRPCIFQNSASAGNHQG